MKKVDAAYLAGFFDGEGCIYISRNKAHNTYQLCLTIAQHPRNISILKHLKCLWGGSIYKYDHNAYINWGGKKSETLILAMLPYITGTSKRAQLKLALKFIDKMPGPYYGGGPTQPKQWMHKAYLRMKKLKRQ